MSKVILVVDDQPSLRQMLRFALSLNGLQVLEAENGLDAFDKLAVHHVDMLIVDWQMPKMDGLQFVRSLRTLDAYADMPIVMVSCRDDLHGEGTKRVSCSVVTWLKKPFTITEIQHVVQCALGLSPRRDEARVGQAGRGCF